MKISQDFEDGAFTCLLYGPAGIGKTTFASWAPKPLIFNIENGLKGIDLKATGAFATEPLQDYVKIKQWLGKFCEQDKYETIVVDSLSKLQELIIASICEGEGKKTLADFAYGSGYQRFSQEAAILCSLFDKLKASSKNVICIAHEQVETFQDPETEPYDRFNCSLDKRIGEKIRANVDHIFYQHYEKIVKDEKKKADLKRIMIQTRPSGGVVAKTRGKNEKYITVNNDESARKIWSEL